jgi:hypothetical protein
MEHPPGQKKKPAQRELGGLDYMSKSQADKSGQSRTNVMTVALAGSGASDCKDNM